MIDEYPSMFFYFIQFFDGLCPFVEKNAILNCLDQNIYFADTILKHHSFVHKSLTRCCGALWSIEVNE